MGRHHMQLADIIINRPKYVECAISVNGIIPWIKENVKNSELKMIAMLKEEFAKELGLGVTEVESLTFYQNLKFVLLVSGIVVQNGFNNSGKKLFVMRDATYRDKMPKYWKSRAKLFKQLIKSNEWKILLKKSGKNDNINENVEKVNE